ncbi:hypothetical protein CYMTET_47573 [Cymbomonas tetramitiformis]|uniref:DUF4476 domain-containing protein n=1 Tax=Cymbomonas tetramitiformis TaxID=36881 RepID=A0AAE0EWG3_9CHLO|nr:hypothetical protein CYMTET_47573 [Cymbomonas tetramitiformis]
MPRSIPNPPSNLQTLWRARHPDYEYTGEAPPSWKDLNNSDAYGNEDGVKKKKPSIASPPSDVHNAHDYISAEEIYGDGSEPQFYSPPRRKKNTQKLSQFPSRQLTENLNADAITVDRDMPPSRGTSAGLDTDGMEDTEEGTNDNAFPDINDSRSHENPHQLPRRRHMKAINARCMVLPNILCTAANGDYFLLPLDQVQKVKKRNDAHEAEARSCVLSPAHRTLLAHRGLGSCWYSYRLGQAAAVGRLRPYPWRAVAACVVNPEARSSLKSAQTKSKRLVHPVEGNNRDNAFEIQQERCFQGLSPSKVASPSKRNPFDLATRKSASTGKYGMKSDGGGGEHRGGFGVGAHKLQLGGGGKSSSGQTESAARANRTQSRKDSLAAKGVGNGISGLEMHHMDEEAPTEPTPEEIEELEERLKQYRQRVMDHRAKMWDISATMNELKGLHFDLALLSENICSGRYSRKCDQIYFERCLDLDVKSSSTVLLETKNPCAELSRISLGSKGTEALSLSLPQNFIVHTLLLRGNLIDHHGVSHLVMGLAKNRLIRSLDLSENPIGAKGATMMAELLCSKNYKMQTLTSVLMNKCDIDDKGAESIAYCLGLGNHTLKTLELSGNRIGDSGAEQMADLLMSNRCLTRVDLSWNSIRVKGSVAIAAALRENTSLQDLDLSTNGIETKGCLFVIEAMGQNTGVLKLDLSSTRAGPEVCLVVCDMLRLNNTLQVLRLNMNPLGSDGGRHLMIGLQLSQSLKTLSVRGSIFPEAGPVSALIGMADFNLRHPDGQYSLDLTKPSMRAVALELFVLNKAMGGNSMTKVVVNGKKFALDTAQWPDDMPDKGQLDFTFTTNHATKREVTSITEKDMQCLIDEFKDIRIADNERLELLRMACTSYFFTCPQVATILATFQPSDEQVTGAQVMWTRVVDGENIEQMVARLSVFNRARVLEKLGIHSFLRHKNLTGHYMLDLTKERDRLVAIKLMEMSLREGDVYTWRNISHNGMFFPMKHNMPEDWKGVVPKVGKLTLDYCSAELPPPHSRSLRMKEYEQLAMKLFGAISSRPEDKICMLREMSVFIYVSAEQVIDILNRFEEPECRVEVVVCMYPRLIDRDMMWKILYALEGLEQALVFHRLGAPQCFNQTHCSLHYILDLGHTEEERIAKMLVQMASKDSSRQNFFNIRVNGRKKVIPESSSMWNVLTTDSTVATVEFDFLGSDWNDICEYSGGARDPEATRQCIQHAGRCDLARARRMHPVWRKGHAALLKSMQSSETKTYETARVTLGLPGEKEKSAPPPGVAVKTKTDGNESPDGTRSPTPKITSNRRGSTRTKQFLATMQSTIMKLPDRSFAWQQNWDARIMKLIKFEEKQSYVAPLLDLYRDIIRNDDGSSKPNVAMEDIYGQLKDRIGVICARRMCRLFASEHLEDDPTRRLGWADFEYLCMSYTPIGSLSINDFCTSIYSGIDDESSSPSKTKS